MTKTREATLLYLIWSQDLWNIRFNSGFHILRTTLMEEGSGIQTIYGIVKLGVFSKEKIS